MQHNVLFNYLKSIRKYKEHTTQKGDLYFRLATYKKEINIDDYVLKEQHISIYAEQDRDAALNQYHYTAVFVGSDKQTYKLHVYFNEHDKYADLIHFVLKGNSSSVAVKLDEDTKTQFIDLAVEQTRPIIDPLKEELSKYVERRIQHYHQAEADACKLSESDALNLGLLIEKLTEISGILSELILLTSEQQHQKYKYILDIITARKQFLAVKKPIAIPTKNKETQPSKWDTEEIASAATEESSSTQHMLTVLKKEEGKVPPKLIALETFEQRIPGIDAIDAKNINEALDSILLVLTETNQNLLTNQISENNLENLIRLQQLHATVHKKALGVFKLALRNCWIDVAERLRMHVEVDKEDINFAFASNFVSVIDFFIKSDFFNPQVQTAIIINEVEYPSPMHYLITLERHISKAMLILLISHDASVLEKDQRGLPLAYTLLKTMSELFEDERVYNKTIGSSLFRKKLIVALQVFLDSNNVSQTERTNIEQEITKLMQHKKRSPALLEKAIVDGGKQDTVEQVAAVLNPTLQKVHWSKEVSERRQELSNMIFKYIMLTNNPDKENKINFGQKEHRRLFFPPDGVVPPDYNEINYFNQLPPNETDLKEIILLDYKLSMATITWKYQLQKANTALATLQMLQKFPVSLKDPLIMVKLYELYSASNEQEKKENMKLTPQAYVDKAIQYHTKRKELLEIWLERDTQQRLTIIETRKNTIKTNGVVAAATSATIQAKNDSSAGEDNQQTMDFHSPNSYEEEKSTQSNVKFN